MRNGAEYLKSCGVRPSLQRLAIYKYVAEHPTHPTADEIYEALKDQIPTLSKTTVYNTVKLLTEQGIIKMITIFCHFYSLKSKAPKVLLLGPSGSLTQTAKWFGN